MECKHDYKVIETKDMPEIDFHTTNDGSLSKRWRTLKCKKCGKTHNEPVL